MEETLVSDAYVIDEDELYVKSEENDYWKNSHVFYLSVKDKFVHQITPSQENWLDKIERGLSSE
jgi:hypothetical protein